MKNKIRIYVAGKLNDDACGYVKNLHNMINGADSVRNAGFSVFIPGLDFLSGLVNGNWEYEDYFENNLPWLKICDALYILPNYKTSNGTKIEIRTAEDLGIPIFYNLKDLIEFKNMKGG